VEEKPRPLKNTGLLNADQLLIAVREGQRDAVENLYDDFMEDFLSWAGQRFSGNQEDFEDAWQDAVIVFYENIIAGFEVVLISSGE
jgi:DNA-directed RNA polymerase specialized sigma24 family protein